MNQGSLTKIWAVCRFLIKTEQTRANAWIPDDLDKAFSKDTEDSDGVPYFVIQVLFGNDAFEP